MAGASLKRADEAVCTLRWSSEDGGPEAGFQPSGQPGPGPTLALGESSPPTGSLLGKRVGRKYTTQL